MMMRVVFLLFAEEREMLPTEQLYWDSYAIRDLLSDLKAQAANGEEPLDESFDAWHRLLAVSQALYSGVNYDEMRMPAYGGSLLDPERFPWMYAIDQRGLRLKVSDRVMMHVLESVQTAVVARRARRVSFRDVDVEQIGYIYEGLLGYSCAVVDDEVVLGLVGKEGEEPEIDAGTLQGLYDDTSDAKSFTAALLDWIKSEQPAAKPLSAAKLAKLYDAEVDEADMRRLLTPVAGRRRRPARLPRRLEQLHPSRSARYPTRGARRGVGRRRDAVAEERGRALHAALARRGSRAARTAATGVRTRPAADQRRGRLAAEVQQRDPRPQGGRHRRRVGGVPGGRGPLSGRPVTEAWIAEGARRGGCGPTLAKTRRSAR